MVRMGYINTPAFIYSGCNILSWGNSRQETAVCRLRVKINYWIPVITPWTLLLSALPSAVSFVATGSS